MIYGVGVDILDSKRIARSKFDLDRFASSILTKAERKIFNKHNDKLGFLSKRWAAKEAISKAIGCGITYIVHWQNIDILKNSQGKPVVKFRGSLYQLFKDSKVRCHLSISDESNFCVAFAILELE